MELLNITLAGDFVVQDGKLCRVGQEEKYKGVFEHLLETLDQGEVHNGRIKLVIDGQEESK